MLLRKPLLCCCHGRRVRHRWRRARGDLQLRIGLQRALNVANRLPAPELVPAFKAANGAVPPAYSAAAASARGLLDDLLSLRDELIAANPAVSAAVDAAVSAGAPAAAP